MKNAVVNYIISWLHAHTQTLSFNRKEIFQGINYLPLTLSSVLGVWAFVQIVKKEDVKWSLQTGSWGTVREVVITCWGQICGRVVYSVRLENTSDRPTSRLCGRPESARQPFQQAAHKKKKKNLQACDLTQRCTQLPKREMTDKILRSMKKNTRRRQSAAAALFDSGAQWLWELNCRCVGDVTASRFQRSTANKWGEAVNTHLISAVIP